MLLAKLNLGTQEDLEKKKREIKELLEGQIQLRSKKILIEKFINENLPNITEADQVEGQFEEFWSLERANALISLAKAENLDLTKLQEVIAQYLFSQKLPLVNEIRPMLTIMSGLKDRNSTFSRIKDKILEFIETFIEGV